MSAITVLQNNAPTGPFTREQVAAKLQTGEFTLEQLAFIEGLAQWTPLRDVLAKSDGAAAPLPPAFIPPQVPAPVSPAFASPNLVPSSGNTVYAGFWLRFVAYIIDTIILGIPLGIVGGVIGATYGIILSQTSPGSRVGFTDENGNPNISFIILELGIWIFSLTVTWLYFAFLESSSAQSTFGKRILSLRVTDLNGNRIGFLNATGRFFGKFLSGITLYIGYIMAGITERKQALHDILAGTLVIRK